MGGDAERLLVERMQALGWRIEDVQRRHVDLEITAQAGSQPVRLVGLSAFSTVGVANAVADPSFFTLQLGEPGRPQRWGGWHKTTNLGQSSIGVQCVASSEGLLAAIGISIAGATNVSAADLFFDSVEELLGQGARTGKPDVDTLPEIKLSRGFQDWPSPLRKTLRKVGQVGVLLAGLGLAAGAVAGGQFMAVPYALFLGIGGATALGFDWTRGAAAAPARAAIATRKRLRALSLFDDVHEPRVLGVAQLPLIRSMSGRYDGVGALVSVGIVAASAARELTLRRCACSMVWPSDAVAACQVLPSAWSVIEVQGPDAVLDAFPMRDRMERERGRLLWLLDEEETEGEVLWQALQEVERGLREGTGSPYR